MDSFKFNLLGVTQNETIGYMPNLP